MTTAGRSRPVQQIDLQHYPLWRRGKARDVFDLGDALLFVATDRVSAFDVVLPTLIPGKGRLLTDISRFWFDRTQKLCPNHVVAYDISSLALNQEESDALNGRCMVVRKAERVDIECVVRSHLAGSGWVEYRDAGTLAGVRLPKGMSPGDALSDLHFTPATKNDSGHDENIGRASLQQRVGVELAERLEELSKKLFAFAQVRAARAGFVLADTKFEFGFVDEELTLIDEVLTPDSSRYWNANDVHQGEEPPGFDKQVIRNWLNGTDWNKEPPAPALPEEIIALAQQRYAEVLDRLLEGEPEQPANAGEVS